MNPFPLLVLVEPDTRAIRHAIETAAIGTTLVVRTETTNDVVDVSEALRAALKPPPIDHWSDALLDIQIPTLDGLHPRTDRQARRGSSGRIERRGYGGRPW